LLESWPGNIDVLCQYADWLESTKQNEHAIEIKQSLSNEITCSELYSTAVKANGRIDVNPYVSIQHWCAAVDQQACVIETAGTLYIKGLALEIATSESEYFHWLQAYLNPMLDCGPNNQEPFSIKKSNYRLVCINANSLVIDIMRLAKSDAIDISTLYQNGQRIHRIFFNANLVIDINKTDGVVWLSNAKTRQVTLLVSSRARWPALAVSSTARAIIVAYLQQEGWLFLHSGAAQINGKNCLVIGDSGQGKTSLLLALMSAGCGFIANERVFVRKTGESIEALSFPMPVAIGLGAAQQYPEIMEYVYNADFCLYPRRRLDDKKLRSTPESKWSSFDDKLQLLAPELITAFAKAKTLQGGLVTGVVIPAIQCSENAEYEDKLTLLDKLILKEIVQRNCISINGDKRYPAWLPLEFEAAPPEDFDNLIDTICQIPSVRFEYIASEDRKAAVEQFPTLIHNALSKSHGDSDA